MLKRIISFLFIILMIFSCSACAEQCDGNWAVNPDVRGKLIETEQWTLFKYDQSGHINLVRLKDPSAVTDGVLEIPVEVEGHQIHGFGHPSQNPMAYDDTFFDPGPDIERIIVPAEIYVDSGFWEGREGRYSWPSWIPLANHIQLLCNTFERIDISGAMSRYTIIIPDGSSGNFANRISESGGVLEDFTFYEYSEWLELENEKSDEGDIKNGGI